MREGEEERREGKQTNTKRSREREKHVSVMSCVANRLVALPVRKEAAAPPKRKWHTDAERERERVAHTHTHTHIDSTQSRTDGAEERKRERRKRVSAADAESVTSARAQRITSARGREGGRTFRN